MVYMGSKNRLASWIVPILQQIIDDNGITTYIEPFGGANIIDKVNCSKKIYYDNNPYLVALLEWVSKNPDMKDIPLNCDKDMYTYVRTHMDEYEDWFVGLIGFCAGFGGRFFQGFASSGRNIHRNMYRERVENLRRQAPNLKGIEFKCQSFESINTPINSLIYCDPPYNGTKTYEVGRNVNFDSTKFYSKYRKLAKNNIVVISEYDMPDDFNVISTHDLRVSIIPKASSRSVKTEKLFTPNDDLVLGGKNLW